MILLHEIEPKVKLLPIYGSEHVLNIADDFVSNTANYLGINLVCGFESKLIVGVLNDLKVSFGSLKDMSLVKL